jgi:hypothetical protein
VSYVNQSMIFDALHKKDRCIGPGLCIKRKLNFAFWAFYEVRVKGILRTSPFGDSPKFNFRFTEF